MARGPNYPTLSFKEAIEAADRLYKQAKRHKTDKESLVHILGYKSLNGRSLRVIGALNAYDLLDGLGDNIGLSEDAETIVVYPDGADEKSQAILRCAKSPQIVKDVHEKFGMHLPGDPLLNAFLLKYGYSHDAVSKIIPILRDTFEIIESVENKGINEYDEKENAYDGIDFTEDEMNQDSSMAINLTGTGVRTMPASVVLAGEKELFSYEFEPNGSLRLMVSGEVDTEEALDILEDLVAMKKREIERKRKKSATTSSDSDTDE